MHITYVYTDGSALNNQRRNSKNTFGGIGAYFGQDDKRNIAEPFFQFPITNQRTEIKASTRAIQSFMEDKIKRKIEEKEKLVIYTDSKYLIGIMTGWITKWKLNYWKTVNGKDVLNKDLIYELDHLVTLYEDWVEIEFKFVKAHRDKKDMEKHRGTEEYKKWWGNLQADILAKIGSDIAKKSVQK